jgi:hypothetical protein
VFIDFFQKWLAVRGVSYKMILMYGVISFTDITLNICQPWAAPPLLAVDRPAEQLGRKQRSHQAEEMKRPKSGKCSLVPPPPQPGKLDILSTHPLLIRTRWDFPLPSSFFRNHLREWVVVGGVSARTARGGGIRLSCPPEDCCSDVVSILWRPVGFHSWACATLSFRFFSVRLLRI